MVTAGVVVARRQTGRSVAGVGVAMEMRCGLVGGVKNLMSVRLRRLVPRVGDLTRHAWVVRGGLGLVVS